MIRLPSVERRMEQPLVVKITIAPIDWQSGRWNRHEEGSGTALDDLMGCSRSNDDHLVSEARRCSQLRLDIGSDASAERRVEGGNVGNAHRLMEAVGRRKHQVKLF